MDGSQSITASYIADENVISTSNAVLSRSPLSDASDSPQDVFNSDIRLASTPTPPPVHLEEVPNTSLEVIDYSIDFGAGREDGQFETAREAVFGMDSVQGAGEPRAPVLETPSTSGLPRPKRPNLKTDKEGKRRRLSDQVRRLDRVRISNENLLASGDADFDQADDELLVNATVQIEPDYVTLDFLTTCETAAREERYKRTTYAKIFKSRFAVAGGTKNLFTVAQRSSPLIIKVCVDAYSELAEKVVIQPIPNFLPNTNKFEFSINILPEVVTAVKAFSNNRRGTHAAGNVSFQFLSVTYFRLAVSERQVAIPFRTLQTLVSALEEALEFNSMYSRMMVLKQKVIICNLASVKKRNGRDCANRALNTVRLIDLYNRMSAACDLKLPYTMVIPELVQRIKCGSH